MTRTNLRRSAREKGMTTVLVALLLLPLLAFAGFAIDLGAWYARAAQIQRGADAAALAGVTLLNRGTSLAEAEARRVATLNGFTDGVDGVTVQVTPLPAVQQLRVIITDTTVPQYLSQLFRQGVSIRRQAQAEQILPVPMGSPRNYLGTGGLLSGGNAEGLFAAISGYCASREQGDRIMPRTDASFTTPNNPPSGTNNFASCQAGNPSYVVDNPEYDADGYFYAVEVPTGYSGNLGIQVFDAPYCARGSGNGPRDQSGTFDTQFTVRNNDSLDPRSATPVAGASYVLTGDSMGSGVCGSPDMDATTSGGATCGSGQWGNCWHTLHTFTSATPGVYFIQVQALQPADLTDQEGTNGFAIRAITNGGFTPCSADQFSASPAYSATCAHVYAVRHLGVYARIGGGGTLYLADVSSQHDGKVMQVTLWDTGEGARSLQLVAPDNTNYRFNWQVLCLDGTEAPCTTGESPPDGGYGPFNNVDIISGLNTSGTQPGAHRLSSSHYNDRQIRITVQLPDNIASTFGGRTWWRIRYDADTDATDRTTWSVQITGDPVRLVPNT